MERHISDTLELLGHKLSLGPLRINQHGVIHLLIANFGEFFIDVQSSAVFIYVLEKFSRPNFDLYFTALSLCDLYAQDSAVLINPIVYGDDFCGFVSKIQHTDFTLPLVESAIDCLSDRISRLKQFDGNF